MSTHPAPDDRRPRRPTGPLWRRALPIAVVALGCAFLLALTYWAGVRTLEGRLLSEAAFRGAVRSNGLVSTSVDRVLNLVSGASLVAAMAVVAGIALLRGRRVQGAAAVGVVLAANATTFVLKRYVLDRPDLGVSEVGPATLNSLPSGHTTAAFSAVGALLLVVPRRLRLPVALGGGAYGALTGLATMSAGWHRAPDAIAGLLVVGGWTAAGALGVALLRPAMPEDPSPRVHPSVRWPTAIGLGFVLLGGVLALLMTAASSLLTGPSGPWLALTSGVLLVVGTALGVVAALLVVLDLMDPPAYADRGHARER